MTICLNTTQYLIHYTRYIMTTNPHNNSLNIENILCFDNNVNNFSTKKD